MIHAIIVPNDAILSSLVSLLEAKVVPLKNLKYTVYSSGALRIIGAYGESKIGDILDSVHMEFAPETVFFLSESFPVSDERRIGDIVLPNVFFTYNPEIGTSEISKDNRDSLLADPLFIEHYELQSDYNFDSFGLSVGGIHVSGTWDSSDEDFRTTLRLVYENDTFDTSIYAFVQKAQELGMKERIYPVAFVGSEDIESSAKNLLSIIRFFIGSITGELFAEEEDAPAPRSRQFNEDDEDTDAWAKSEDGDEDER